jgi:hypothetical protein
MESAEATLDNLRSAIEGELARWRSTVVDEVSIRDLAVLAVCDGFDAATLRYS